MLSFLARLSAALVTLTLLLPSVLRASELDAAIRALPGTEAQFTQKFTPRGFTKPQVERGTVTFGTLPRMRWSYAGAEPRLFVFDGAESWLYTPAEKQVQISSVDATQQRSLPFAFLWNAAALRDYKVAEQRRGGTVTIALKPLSAKTQFKDVTLIVDGVSHAINRVEYGDRAGNRTVFDFGSQHKVVASPELFRFSPPAGVETVRN